MTASLRPRGADGLGLRRGARDRLLPLLVAAMVFLAALAGAGSLASAGLARHWLTGTQSGVTIEVPQPEDGRAQAAAAVLGPAAHRLSEAEVAELLRPWLGADLRQLAVSLPAVFTLQGTLLPAAAARLEQAAPGSLVAQEGGWQARLAALAASLEACADLVLAMVASVAAALVAVASRAGLAAQRGSIEIVHGLGATDGMIAGCLAARVMALAGAGGLLGAMLAVPVLARLAQLAAPFQPAPGLASHAPFAAALPTPLWALLVSLPLLAAAIGWAATQATVRVWLRRLP